MPSDLAGERLARPWHHSQSIPLTVPTQHRSFSFTKLSVTLSNLHQNSEAPGRSPGNLYTRLETIQAKLPWDSQSLLVNHLYAFLRSCG